MTGWRWTMAIFAVVLGSIPPREERLLARLTAWTQQLFDADLRAELLNTSLARVRREAPDVFLGLIGEWLRPERTALWPNGIEAVISAAADPEFENLPPLMKVIEPVVVAAPAKLQTEIEDLILALYSVSPTETTYFVRQVLLESENPMTAITFRRIAPSLPAELREEVREFIKGKA